MRGFDRKLISIFNNKMASYISHDAMALHNYYTSENNNDCIQNNLKNLTNKTIEKFEYPSNVKPKANVKSKKPKPINTK